MAEGPGILYQNSSKKVTLLDIPRSIVFAQCTSDRPFPMSIYSSPALEEPWLPTEPKTARAKANVAAHGMINESSFKEQDVVQNALKELHTVWKGDWCLERKVNPDLQEPKIHAPSTGYGRFAEQQRSEPFILKKLPACPLRPYDLHVWPVHNSSSGLVNVPVEVVFNHNAMHPLLHTTSTIYRMPVRKAFAFELPNRGSISP